MRFNTLDESSDFDFDLYHNHKTEFINNIPRKEVLCTTGTSLVLFSFLSSPE